MEFLTIYLAAYIIDLIIGDPNYRFHPIRVIGNLILNLENLFYRLKNKKLGGLFLLIATITTIFIFCYSILKITQMFSPILSTFMQIFLLYTTLATKCLADEGKKVYKILKNGGLELAKKELSYLVTRDTKSMSQEEIVKSTVETISENSVDGIIAPMIYALIGSYFSWEGISLAVPVAMCYKGVNTLDSMVGYKNEKYLDFGYFSAKFDDVVNFIPARVTGGVLIPISAFLLNCNWISSIKIFLRDRKNHDSPNSGHPEASFAGALGVQFGGEVTYFGEVCEKKKIGNKVNEFTLEIIKKACNLLYATSIVGILVIVLIKNV